MALAETAKVVVQMDLAGNFAGAVKTAEADMAKFAASASGSAAGAVSKLEGSFNKLGGALSHAKSQIGGLLSGPLGILGLGAGILGVGSIIEGSLRKTSDFGLELEKLTGLTGETAQSMGELTLVAARFGVDFDHLAQVVGFTEKTLGKLQNTSASTAKGHMTVAKATEEVTKAHEKLSLATLKLTTDEQKKHVSAVTLAGDQVHLADATRELNKAESDLADATANKGVAGLNKLQAVGKQYGVVLTDSKGKALDFSTVLNHVADFYTSNASAANKAALAAQVFGRGYATLIPVLQLGSKGIDDAKQSIKDLGLSLGTDTQGALEAYKSGLRGLGEAVEVLQIEIGLQLAPTMTKLATGITNFLEHGGAKQITDWFHEGAQDAEAFGSFIADSVIPALQGIASAAQAAWGAIPDPIKQLLVGGFIANKAIKWTFGIDIAGSAIDAIKSAVGKGLATSLATAGVGKLFVQPVFVTNPGFGNLAGAGGAANAAEGVGAGALAGGGGLGASAGVAGVSALVGPLAIALVAAVGAPLLVAGVLKALGLGTQQTMSDQQAAASQGRGKGGGNDPAFVSQFAPKNVGGQQAVAHNMSEIADASAAAAQRLADIKDADQSINSSARSIQASAAGIHSVDKAALAAFKAKWGDDKSLLGGIKARAEAAFHHSVSASAIAATLQRDLIKRAGIIMDSTRSASTKLADLKVLQNTAIRHHDTKAAAMIAKQIATITAVNNAKSGIVGAINQAAGLPAGYLDRGKDNPGGGGGLSPHQLHVLHVHATVSTRQTQSAQTTTNRYGKVSQTYVPT